MFIAASSYELIPIEVLKYYLLNKNKTQLTAFITGHDDRDALIKNSLSG